MKNQRPVYLNLFKIKLPMPGLVSILHRVSGILIFLALPFLLWTLGKSLSSETEFQNIKENSHPMFWFFIWVSLSAVLFHLIAGIRHMVMDLGWGESKLVGNLTAVLVLIISAISIIWAGVWLW